MRTGGRAGYRSTRADAPLTMFAMPNKAHAMKNALPALL